MASPGGRNPPAPSTAGSIPARRTLALTAGPRPGRLSVEDATPSRWRGGFDSRSGCSARGSPPRGHFPRRGGCPAGSHKAGPPGSTPGPGTLVWRIGRGRPWPSDFDLSGWPSQRRRISGGWSNGKTPGLHPGNRGSNPRLSTRRRPPVPRRKVAGYGSPGLTANECALRGMRVRIPCLPLVAPETVSAARPVRCVALQNALGVCRIARDPPKVEGQVRSLARALAQVSVSFARPRSVTDSHATLRKSQTRFDSWRGRSCRSTSRLEPASGTVHFVV